MKINSGEQEKINKELNNISKTMKNIANIDTNYIEYFSALIYAVYENMKRTDDFFEVKSENITYILDKTLEEIRRKENSIKLFINIRFQDTIYKEDYTILGNIIIRLRELIKEVEEFNQNGKSILAEAFEYIIMMEAKNKQMPLRNDVFYTPKALVKVIVELLNLKDKMAVYNPACGTGEFIIESAKKANIYAFGDELNINNYNICMTNLWLHNIYNKRIKGDINEKLQKVDIAIANPPFSDSKKDEFNINNSLIDINIPQTTSTYIKYLVMMLESVHNQGKLAIILPHGFLFKKKKNDSYIREKLINNNYIEAIIGLPEKLFYNTKIPVIILLLNKSKKRQDILFIDASKEYTGERRNNILTIENQNKIIDTYKKYKKIPNYSNIVTIDEIKKNNYNLNIKEYVLPADEIEDINEEKIKYDLNNLENEKNNIEYKIKDLIRLINKE